MQGISRLVALAVACLFALGMPVRSAFGETPSPDPKMEEIRTLIRTLQKEREKVRTGRVKLTGRKTVEIFENSKASWEGPMEGLYTFNREANLFRYDGVSPGKFKANLPGDVSLPSPGDGAKTPVTAYRYGHCRSKNYFCSWFQVDPRSVSDIALLPLDRERENRGSGEGATFHVLAFGVLDDLGFKSSVDLAEGHERLLAYKEGRLEKGDQNIRLELYAGESALKMTIDRQLTVPTQLKRGWPEIPNYSQVDVEWRVISGVAVPVKYTTSETVPDSDRQTLEIKLDWVSINEEIPDDEFSYTAFRDIPDNRIEVQDIRKKPVAILGRLRSDGTVTPLPR